MNMNASSSKTKVEHWLRWAADRLEQAGVGSARLDCLILLEDLLLKDRSWLLAHPEHSLTPAMVKKLEEQIVRRADHEPLAYIRGFTEFYGRRFIVNKTVLEPRPESEDMITLLKDIVKTTPVLAVADVGTGSGALAITAKLELPKATVIATDIDPKCLKVAKSNAQKHDAEVKFFQGDLLSPIPSTLPLSIILANLPYVPDSHKINQAAAMEPKIAIFGGPDGLSVYRRLFSDPVPPKPRFILTESLPPQHQKLASIGRSAGYRLTKSEGFIQLFTAAS